ncbi:Nickel/cobalt transporter regulator [Sphingomonas gellani]|uniref:Nickel/cobalt transporter regulator n=1 Tax=Sphingomonas gellani TaxID=1166340 RepID=A0A1H7ZCA7_9SPHN|nr:RcnB family protein [Sphingomonas gellani]SEM55883.1 Nickel/cobalt transporter regulator [Sphingomonas gellani]
MKTFAKAMLAATLTISPLIATMAEAAPQHRTTTVVRDRGDGRTVVTTRTTARDWRPGQRFERRYAPNYRRVTEYRTYRLRAPQRGFYWARSGRDAVLVRPNGTIAEVRRGAFR